MRYSRRWRSWRGPRRPSWFFPDSDVLDSRGVLHLSRELLRLQELMANIDRLDALITRMRSRLVELEEARRLLSETKPRRVYRIFGNRVMVELSMDEARRFVEEDIEATRIQLKKLEEERERLIRELRELEKKLGLV